MATAVRRPHPPGPPTSLFRSIRYRPTRDPIAFFSGLARDYGDLVYVRLAGERVYFVNDPGDIKDVLVTNQRFFHKGRGLERSRRMLGRGLLTSEDDLHRKQRRLIQPAFHRDRIASYADVMTMCAERSLHDEVDRTLRGRLPSLADIPLMPFAERVIAESMRLYPPAWRPSASGGAWRSCRAIPWCPSPSSRSGSRTASG